VNPVLADTGFLVALYDPTEKRHARAWAYLRAHEHPLATVAAVIVETCFFLNPSGKLRFLGWVREGALAVVDTPVADYVELERVLSKYRDRNIDFADAALVWLANQLGVRAILTGDHADFQVLRLKGNRGFELIDW
jgi:predicted nucleic acid-binding protein